MYYFKKFYPDYSPYDVKDNCDGFWNPEADVAYKEFAKIAEEMVNSIFERSLRDSSSVGRAGAVKA